MKAKEIFKKYYPFWLGLFVIVCLIGVPIMRMAPSLGMLCAFIIGYFQLTKLH